MSRRLHRLWLMPLLLLASQSWALGLGDIRISSALNQPLRAEIELLATTPEELNNLSIALASAETFERYDLDRPLYLTRINFEVVRSGRADGNFIRVTSVKLSASRLLRFWLKQSGRVAGSCANTPCCLIRRRLQRHRLHNPVRK